MSEQTSYGWAVGPGEYGLRGIIAQPKKSMAGNLILEVGVENTGAVPGWHKVAHVVLTPEEAAALHAAIGEQIGVPPPAGVGQHPDDHEHRPAAASITDYRGVAALRGSRPEQYPLFGTCRDCAHLIVCMDITADWSDHPAAVRQAGERSGRLTP